MGYVREALEKKGYLEHPRSACWTDDMFEIFVFFGQCLCCFLPVFVNRQPYPHNSNNDQQQASAHRRPLLLQVNVPHH